MPLILIVTIITRYLSRSSLQKEGFIILPNGLGQKYRPSYPRERVVAEHKATGVVTTPHLVSAARVECRLEVQPAYGPQGAPPLKRSLQWSQIFQIPQLPETISPVGDPVFKHRNLWDEFHIQNTASPLLGYPPIPGELVLGALQPQWLA